MNMHTTTEELAFVPVSDNKVVRGRMQRFSFKKILGNSSRGLGLFRLAPIENTDGSMIESLGSTKKLSDFFINSISFGQLGVMPLSEIENTEDSNNFMNFSATQVVGSTSWSLSFYRVG